MVCAHQGYEIILISPATRVYYFTCGYRASLIAQLVKSLPEMQETQVGSLGQEDTWRRKWHPTPVFLPGESQGWGSLMGCCQWGRTEWDTTEAT